MIEDKSTQILLVEDDIFLSNIYKAKFEMDGFKVIVAGDGEAALEEIKKKRPDIVLLDILLPKLDGFGVIAAIKQNKETKNIPVFFLTNLGQKEDVEKGIELGASDYLIKAHFTPAEIVEKVKKILGI